MRAVVIAVGSVAFAVGLGVLVFLLVRPRGERVGALSLMDPNATLLVAGAPGATFRFRTDVEVALARLSLVSDDQLEREVDRALRRSTLTVRATTTGGVERTATCSIYGGRAMTTTITPGALSRTGMLSDCALALDGPGPWQLRGSANWAPELQLRSAELEARLELGPR